MAEQLVDAAGPGDKLAFGYNGADLELLIADRTVL